ncbi:hypothetical protein [Actinokineospora sp. NPDC004072]
MFLGRARGSERRAIRVAVPAAVDHDQRPGHRGRTEQEVGWQVTDMSEWPIVVTNRCADACAEAFGLAGRDQARAWLSDLVSNNGEITDRLPAPVAGRRSPSGHFVLVENVLILPLAHDRDGAAHWIATNCIAIPGTNRPAATAARVDPFQLTGRDLLSHVNVLPHAVERFQQRCGGHRLPERARQELLDTIAPTVRAQPRPPRWCGTRPADLYLVAGTDDEFCLPCRTGGGARAFDVITCIHRAADLFTLNPIRLAAQCRLDPDALPPGGRQARLITESFRFSGRLSWHKPRWARPYPDAKWWIVFDNGIAAPVAWHPEVKDKPLLVMAIADHRPWIIRVLSRLRRA